MVVIGRLRQVQQVLQQQMDPGRAEQVLASGDQRDPLGRVIDHDRQMVRGSHAAPRQDHVADIADKLVARHAMRTGGHRMIAKFELVAPQMVEGAGHVQTDHVIGPDIRHRPVPTGAGIDQSIGAGGQSSFLRGGQGGADVAATAAAGIAERCELGQRPIIGGHAI